MLIRTGSVPVVWTNEEIINIPYQVEDISESEKEPHKKQGYTHNQYSGDIYRCIDWKPAWANGIADEIGLQNCGFTFYRMKQLDIRPQHVDHFANYSNIYNVSQQDVCRAVVFLQDWKVGHYLDLNNTGYVNWTAGDYVLWQSTVVHSAANIGIDYRYTLQITGTLK